MVVQKCVRTYDLDCSRNACSTTNCEELNNYLNEGWTVVTVTSKSNYNEYIIEKKLQIGEKRNEQF